MATTAPTPSRPTAPTPSRPSWTVLAEVVEDLVASYLDAVSLGRFEVAGGMTTTTAWEKFFLERYGLETMDYRRSYGAAMRGEDLVSWSRRRVELVRGFEPLGVTATEFFGEKNVTIFGKSGTYQGVVVVPEEETTPVWHFVADDAGDDDDLGVDVCFVQDRLIVHRAGYHRRHTWSYSAHSGGLRRRRIGSAESSYTPTVHHSCDVVNGNVVLVGGQGLLDGEPTTEVRILRGPQWEDSHPLPWATAHHATCVIDDEVLLVAGGLDESYNGTRGDVWFTTESWDWVTLDLIPTVQRNFGGTSSDVSTAWHPVWRIEYDRGGPITNLHLGYDGADDNFHVWRCSVVQIKRPRPPFEDDLIDLDIDLAFVSQAGILIMTVDLQNGYVRRFHRVATRPCATTRFHDALAAPIGNAVLVLFGGYVEDDEIRSWDDSRPLHNLQHAHCIDLSRGGESSWRPVPLPVELRNDENAKYLATAIPNGLIALRTDLGNNKQTSFDMHILRWGPT